MAERAKITDPRPNQHQWCGILRTDGNVERLLPNKNYVFFKANRDSHFFSHGTVVMDMLIMEGVQVEEVIDMTLDEIEKNLSALKSKESYNRESVRKAMFRDIEDCRQEVEDKGKLVIITAISVDETSPLGNLVNEFVEKQFSNESWLDENSERVGALSIRLGRILPRIPFPGKITSFS